MSVATGLTTQCILIEAKRTSHNQCKTFLNKNEGSAWVKTVFLNEDTHQTQTQRLSEMNFWPCSMFEPRNQNQKILSLDWFWYVTNQWATRIFWLRFLLVRRSNTAFVCTYWCRPRCRPRSLQVVQCAEPGFSPLYLVALLSLLFADESSFVSEIVCVVSEQSFLVLLDQQK